MPGGKGVLRDRSRGCFGRKPVPTPVLASCLFPKHIAVHDVHLKKVSALPHFSKSFDAAATSGITASDSANNARKLDAPELRYRILERLGEGFFAFRTRSRLVCLRPWRRSVDWKPSPRSKRIRNITSDCPTPRS